MKVLSRQATPKPSSNDPAYSYYLFRWRTRSVRAVTSGPLYRFFLGFECRKNVIGMVLDSEVPIAAGVEQLDRVRRTRRASVEKSK